MHKTQTASAACMVGLLRYLRSFLVFLWLYSVQSMDSSHFCGEKRTFWRRRSTVFPLCKYLRNLFASSYVI